MPVKGLIFAVIFPVSATEVPMKVPVVLIWCLAPETLILRFRILRFLRAKPDILWLSAQVISMLPILRSTISWPFNSVKTAKNGPMPFPILSKTLWLRKTGILQRWTLRWRNSRSICILNSYPLRSLTATIVLTMLLWWRVPVDSRSIWIMAPWHRLSVM